MIMDGSWGVTAACVSTFANTAIIIQPRKEGLQTAHHMFITDRLPSSRHLFIMFTFVCSIGLMRSRPGADIPDGFLCYVGEQREVVSSWNEANARLLGFQVLGLTYVGLICLCFRKGVPGGCLC